MAEGEIEAIPGEPMSAHLETAAYNREIERNISRYRNLTPEQLCDLVCDGEVLGIVDHRLDDVAQERTISGPRGDIPLRIFVPDRVNGAYLHLHGGGWVSGSHQGQDQRLWTLAQSAHAAVVSVGYRLAPANAYPGPNDDCEAAAEWLIANSQAEFGVDRLGIGGESAGAQLAAGTLLRLREKSGFTSMRCAVFTSGVFDLRHTPSSRNWGDRPLVLTSGLMRSYVDQYAPPKLLDDPDVSPIFGRLRGLPSALFSVGTADPLLDDTLFMASRWAAAGNRMTLRAYSEAPHGFDALPITVGAKANATIAEFVRRWLAD
jgi:acetyl esterase/lipase